MPWLWLGDPPAWQQVAQSMVDAGFLVLDNLDLLKHRETKQVALKCVADALLQEGHPLSNILVATVSKLTHGLRGGEGAAPFAADTLLLTHCTPLPRLFLMELTQHCTPQELTAQGGFQRALGAFLVAVAERLPHLVLANISVLLPLLDVDCYPLRSATVECIGHLLNAEGKKLPKGACSIVQSQAAVDAAAKAIAEGGDPDAAADEVAAGQLASASAEEAAFFSIATN